MAHRIVKILTSDDGDMRQEHLRVWHLVEGLDASPRTFCEGEAFGYGESGCEYKDRMVKRGAITCPKCLYLIRKIKGIKL